MQKMIQKLCKWLFKKINLVSYRELFVFRPYFFFWSKFWPTHVLGKKRSKVTKIENHEWPSEICHFGQQLLINLALEQSLNRINLSRWSWCCFFIVVIANHEVQNLQWEITNKKGKLQIFTKSHSRVLLHTKQEPQGLSYHIISVTVSDIPIMQNVSHLSISDIIHVSWRVR